MHVDGLGTDEGADPGRWLADQPSGRSECQTAAADAAAVDVSQYLSSTGRKSIDRDTLVLRGVVALFAGLALLRSTSRIRRLRGEESLTGRQMAFEVRLPWFMLFLLSLATALKQYEDYGYVAPEVVFICMAHWLYANACAKGEELICTTW